MAVVARKRKNGIVYLVATWFNKRQYWEEAGSDQREAKRLSERRKREVKAGTYTPPAARTGGITVAGYAERWFAGRTGRNAVSERQQATKHGLGVEWFAELKMEDVRPPHFDKLIKAIRAMGEVSEKTIANVLWTIRTMFAAAHFEEIIPHNPYALPPRALRRRSKPRLPYTRAEAALLLSDRVDPTLRVMVALALWTGMRKGEICGRRWGDWERDAKPLTGLRCHTQYEDQPLKGDGEEGEIERARTIPVHPELAAVLTWWWDEGFELVHLRRPTPRDFIVPRLRDHVSCNSAMTIYSAWCRACRDAGVENRSMHSTRHTFITFARRATPFTDRVEAITHNAKGATIDMYNHFEWASLCEAVQNLHFDESVDRDARPPSFSLDDSGLVPGDNSRNVVRLGKATAIKTNLDASKVPQVTAGESELDAGQHNASAWSLALAAEALGLGRIVA